MESRRQNSLLKDKQMSLTEQNAQPSDKVECHFSPFQTDTGNDSLNAQDVNKSATLAVNSSESYDDFNENEDYEDSAGSVESEAEKPDVDEEVESEDACQGDQQSDGDSIVEDECVEQGNSSKNTAILAKQSTITRSTQEEVDDYNELEDELTPDLINTVKTKLETYKEQKEMFKSVQLDFLPGEDLSDLLFFSETNEMNTSTEMSSSGTKIETDLLNELKRMKVQLKTRTKQLDKATELLQMMKKGLSDRGTYIKLLIQDNKKLRKEVKLAMKERQTICEKFANEPECSDALNELDGTQSADFEPQTISKVKYIQ